MRKPRPTLLAALWVSLCSVALAAVARGAGPSLIRGAHQAPSAAAAAELTNTRAAMGRGDVSQALDSNQKAARLDSLSSVVFETLGTTYLAANRPREAYDAFRRASLLDPSSASAFNRAGQVLLSQLGRSAGALGAFRQALAVDPGFAPAHYSLSIYHLLRGELDDAEREVENAFEYATSDLEQSVFFGAKAQLLLPRGKLGEAESTLREQLFEHPTDRRAQQAHVLALRLLGRYNQADAEVLALLTQVQPQAVLLNEAGLVLAGLGKRDSSEAFFHRAWDLDSTAAEAGYHLARTRLAAGDTSAALSWLARVEAREPGWFPTAELAGRIHAARGDATRARRAFERAWRLRPVFPDLEAAAKSGASPEGAQAADSLAHDPATLLGKAREALAAGDLSLAIYSAYQACVDPKARPLALLLTTDCARPSGLSPGSRVVALDAALQGLGEKDRTTRALLERELGTAYARIGSGAEAREHLQKALALVPPEDPFSAPAVAELIRIDLDLGDRVAAAALAAKAPPIDDTALLAARARLAEASGDATRAAALREQARAAWFLPS